MKLGKESKIIPPVDAEEIRKRDLNNLPGYSDYLADSDKLSRWKCGRCETVNIPCTCGDCPQCGHARPVDTHADPEQGESRELGSQRRRR